MKKRRHTPEQVVRKLREADRLLGEGQERPEVVKALEVPALKEISKGNWLARRVGARRS